MKKRGMIEPRFFIISQVLVKTWLSTSMTTLSPQNPQFFQSLGCKYPIVQAPMAGVQDSRLAIAVCQTGGIGSLPCAMLNLAQIESQITAIRDQTEGVFNVNFFAHQSVDYTPQMQEKWFNAMQPYYTEFGLAQVDIMTTGGRQPFNRETAELIADLKLPIVSFHFGLPEPELLALVKSSGAKIWSSATTIAEAKWLELQGVDAVIAQGLEAGGHRGMFLSPDITLQMGTFSLLPHIVKAVKVPVIGAGGISDGTTANAAFDMGASMVQVGTAFLLAEEADTKPFHRQALQSERVLHTTLTNLFSGGLARGIVNRFIAEMGYIHADAPPFPHASFVTNPVKNAAETQNNDDFSALWAGQNASLAKAGTAKQIIENLMKG